MQAKLKRLDSRASKFKAEKKTMQRKRELKSSVVKKTAKGKRPYYLKKSEIKKQLLLDKFKTLKLAGDLPENVNFAVRGKLMAEFMEDLGLTPSYNTITNIKSPTRIDEEASRYTVLVLCRN